MRNFETGPASETEFNASRKEKIEDFALRAVEEPQIIEAIKNSNTKIEAITKVRALLPDLYPEITDIPVRKGTTILEKSSANFEVAKHAVLLIFDDIKQSTK